MTRTATLATLVAAILLVGCGTSGPPNQDPRAVALAYTHAAFQCGEQGAGAQYDLSTTSAPTRWTRDAFLAYQQRHGCQPRTIPSLTVHLEQQRGDFALVEVLANPAPPDYRPGLYTLVREHSGWRVDTNRSSNLYVSS